MSSPSPLLRLQGSSLADTVTGVGRRRACGLAEKGPVLYLPASPAPYPRLPAPNTGVSPALSQSRKSTRVTCHGAQSVPRTALGSAETVCEVGLEEIWREPC
ncbi:hypothetical protein E2I00_001910 [Balaenoptera physalus]|uniref:Uncharacterized protein n=1 Tax=Balaenoptera physalus TaxID=9770 RepID=A0A6A1Q6Z7_BALPH|nr:hypothetical protein E2I00_001910 [Balaenoptera physalus]